MDRMEGAPSVSGQPDSDQRIITPSQSVLRIRVRPGSDSSVEEPNEVFHSTDAPDVEKSILCYNHRTMERLTAKSHLPYTLWIMILLWIFQLIGFSIKAGSDVFLVVQLAQPDT